MKLMSFNIQHGMIYGDAEGRIDLDRTAGVIRDFGADIVALNEVRSVGSDGKTPGFFDQTEYLAKTCGLNGIFAPAIEIEGKGLYGNALLSAFPIKNYKVIPIVSPKEHLFHIHGYEDRCLLSAEFDTPDGLRVYVCHMGLNPDERLLAVKAICRELDAWNGNAVLMGDFNMTPDNELLLPLRERLADTAELKGKALPTYPSDAPRRKIDYIFVSKTLADDVCDAGVFGETSSDHLPHYAVLG